jgi:transcriptional regulator with XRE-family HTH domain
VLLNAIWSPLQSGAISQRPAPDPAITDFVQPLGLQIGESAKLRTLIWLSKRRFQGYQFTMSSPYMLYVNRSQAGGKTMIGHRIKVARAAAGLSLRDLAEAMGGVVSAQAIGKYERDEDMPGSRALIALADALGVTEDYLLSENEIALEGVDFRKKAGSSAREEATLEARTIHMLERYLTVEDLLQLRSVDWEQPRSAPHPVADVRDAEDAARSVRDDWGLGNEPIPQLAELLEERGVKVMSLDLDDIDGLAAKVRRRGRDAARVIVIKRSTWSERKRFNLAHELGHMVLNVAAGGCPACGSWRQPVIVELRRASRAQGALRRQHPGARVSVQGLGYYQPGGLFKALPDFRGTGLEDRPVCGASDDEAGIGGAQTIRAPVLPGAGRRGDWGGARRRAAWHLRP